MRYRLYTRARDMMAKTKVQSYVKDMQIENEWN